MDEEPISEDYLFELHRDRQDERAEKALYVQMKQEIAGLQGVLRDYKQKLELKDGKIQRLENEITELKAQLDEVAPSRYGGHPDMV
jgi:predicted  nucleic acid-binding Zn-ribbon protein